MIRNKVSVGKKGFLTGLAKDESGNIIMIAAAAILPLTLIIGSAIDTSRAYMVKARLQNACDSAVLAGRRSIKTAAFTGVSAANAKARANEMFRANYPINTLGTTGVSTNGVDLVSSINTTTGEFSGTATARMPTAIMQIMGVTKLDLTAECNADIQVPNIDTMMVLDVTGSMGECPNGSRVGNNGCTADNTKIIGMRAAIKNFYTTMKASTATSPKSILRYGFVPYDGATNGSDLFSSNPNESQISTSNMANNNTYESRVANFNTPVKITYETYRKGLPPLETNSLPTASPSDATPISFNDCTGITASTEGFTLNKYFSIDGGVNVGTTSNPTVSGKEIYYANGSYTTVAPNSGTYQKITYSIAVDPTTWTNRDGGTEAHYKTCTRRKTIAYYGSTPSDITGYGFTNWIYKPVSYDISNYKNKNELKYIHKEYDVKSIARYTQNAGQYTQVQLVDQLKPNKAEVWDYNNFDPASGPLKLNEPTVWGINWNGCLEEPKTIAAEAFKPIPSGAYDLKYNNAGTDDNTYFNPMLGNVGFSRPSPSQISTDDNSSIVWPACPSAKMKNLNVVDKDFIDAYVSTLTPGYYTYHDVGMAWGLRLISPNGMFADRNRIGTNGSQISRNIIFMTDGEQTVNMDYYSAWGYEKTSQRVGDSTTASAVTRHALRFQALCDAARNEKVSVWVIAFGTTLTSNLTQCADANQAFQASDSAQLNVQFQKIAAKIADLRLTK